MLTPSEQLDETIERVGFGRFQIILMLTVGMVGLADGAEMTVLSITSDSPNLQRQFGVSSAGVGALGSAVFVGFLLGSLFWGVFGDKFGRRLPCIILSFSMTVFGVLSAFADSFTTLIVLRTCMGFSIGGIAPNSFAILTEFMPRKRRGFLLTIGAVFFSLGELMEALFAKAIMPAQRPLGFSPADNWRALLIVSALPGLVGFFTMTLLLPESPRFLLVSGQTDRLRDLLSALARANGKEAEARELIEKMDDDIPVSKGGNVGGGSTLSIKENSSSRGNVRLLLSPALRRTTLLVWCQWFVLSFVFYGYLFILPLAFSEHKNEHIDTYGSLAISALCELPGVWVVALLIDHPKLGRRRSTAAFMATTAFFSLLAGVMSNGFHDSPREGALFVAMCTAAKSAIGAAFCVVYVFTAEIYPTDVRAIGIGCGSAASRVGGILTPLVGTILYKQNNAAPFYIYAVAGAFGCCAALAMKTETSSASLNDTSNDTGDAEEHQGLIGNGKGRRVDIDLSEDF